MRKERQIGRVLGAGLLAAGLVAGIAFGRAVGSAQSALPTGPGPDSKAPGTLVALRAPEAAADGPVMRTIDDPPTGHRWLLMRDQEHPGGPGRLILSTEVRAGAAGSGQVSGPGASTIAKLTPGTSVKAGQISGAVPQPQIRAGDRLLIEEHSRIADVQLSAVALGPARIGSILNARLEIGGRVVRVVAVGPGRASFAVETETHP